MKIKTNVRAGKGGTTGVGHNSSGDSDPYTPPPPPPAPVSRCVGI